MAMFLYILVFVSIILSFIFFEISLRINRDVPLTNWPIVGMLPAVIQNVSRIHDYATLLLKHYGGTLMFEGIWFTNTSFILTSDPMNVHHITSKNFSNYGKGPLFKEIFDVFGGGILNSDDIQAWKKERTILHSLLRRKSYSIFIQKIIQKKLETSLIPFLDHASRVGVEVDLQDVFQRFTFDRACCSVLGYDPHSLPNNFIKLSHCAYERGIVMIEEIAFRRHITPRCLWKLQQWLQIGQEKKFTESRNIFDKFLYECIASKREEQNRCNNTKEVDDTDPDLLRMLMEERVQKGKLIDDEYLRDTAFAFVAAGSSIVQINL